MQVPDLDDYLLSLGVSLPWLTSFQVDGVCPGDSTPGGLAVSPWLSSFVKLTRLSITRVPVLFQGRFPLAATARLTDLTLCRTGVCRTSLLQQSALCTLTLDSVDCEGPIVPVSVSSLTSLRSLTLVTKSDESIIVPLRSNLPSSLTALTLQNPHTLVEYGPVDVAFHTLPLLRHLELTLHAQFSPDTDWYQCLRHLTCLRLNALEGDQPQPAIAVLSRLTALRSLTVRYPRPVSLDLTLPPNLVSLALWGFRDYLLEPQTEPQGMCSIADIRRSAPHLSIVAFIDVYLRVSHDDLKHLMLSSDIRIQGPVKYSTYM